MINKEDIKIIDDILSRGNDIEIRKRPKTGEILIIEVKKNIRNGK